MPKVFKFLTCALTLYFGYVVCGWLVLGPFNPKFRTLIITSQTLFSLLNGDDMFATFRMLEPGGPSFFSQFYLYSFICLFIYTVLSLFISVVMDSYETIKVFLLKNPGFNLFPEKQWPPTSFQRNKKGARCKRVRRRFLASRSSKFYIQ